LLDKALFQVKGSATFRVVAPLRLVMPHCDWGVISMAKRSPKVDTILSNLAAIADACAAVSEAAPAVARDPEATPEIAAACDDLDRSIRHVLDIGSYIMRNAHADGMRARETK
jgi:hypothetical protein